MDDEKPLATASFSAEVTATENASTLAPTALVTELPTETPCPEATLAPDASEAPDEETFSLPHDNEAFDIGFAKTLLAINTAGSADGFETVLRANEECKKGEHTSAFFAAERDIEYEGETRSVLLIVIFGTNGNEWYSNFDFAPSHDNATLYAECFDMAADDIVEKLSGVLSDDKLIVVTGYSRGGAVANLIGYKLNKLGYKDNTFTYTFATPNTVRSDFTDCENIFNIINANDLVPMLPPTYMGYKRLGTDIVLGTENVITYGIKLSFENFQKNCPDISSYYNEKFSLSNDQTGEGMTPFEFVSGILDVALSTPISEFNLSKLMPEVSDDSKLAPLKNIFSIVNVMSIVNNHMYETYQGLLADFVLEDSCP